MTRRIRYEFGGESFHTKDEIQKRIARKLHAQPVGVTWTDIVLEDVAARWHYAMAALGLRPEAFVKRPSDRPNGWSLAAVLADLGVRSFSYRKCLQPWTFRHEVDKILRERVEPAIVAARGPLCGGCGRPGLLDVHHVDPPWKTIVDGVWLALPEDVRDGGGGMEHVVACWRDDVPYELPADFAGLFDAAHATAVLETLCKPCHRALRSRRTASKPGP